MIKSISKEASRALKALLETKHIYQSVVIEADPIIAAWRKKAESFGATIGPDDLGFETQHFVLGEGQLHIVEHSGVETPALTLSVQNPKLFCAECGSGEVFKPLWYRNLASELNHPVAYPLAGRSQSLGEQFPGFELIFIALQCQLCCGKPDAFIVRKKGWRLILEGRSPMEHVEVPSFVPKPERNLFRDALIASHGGKILAALFYLRVFIEQFARRVLNETGRRYGAELMEEYGKTLPDDKRSLMPSLREWYEKLSEPIHTATDDSARFEEALAAIQKHFEIRKVFDIPEGPAK